MAKIIEARAVISAEDKTGAVFDKVAKKFDALARSTKSAEQVARLTNSLKDAETQLKAIDKFNTSRGVFADARSRFRDAQVGIERASRAMAAAEKPTRAMEAAYRRAQTAVSGASRAFEEQKAIVIGARRALETSGVPLNKIAAEQQKLRTHVERTTRALHQQRQVVEASPATTVAKRLPHRGQEGETPHSAPTRGNGVLSAIGETGALYTAGRVAKHAIKEGSDFQHERVRMEASGMAPGEIDAAEKEASHLSKKYLPVSQTQIMHMLRNTRSVVGNYHEAAEIADPLLALRVVAMGAHPEKSDELNEDFDKLVKGMEIKGVTQDHGKFNHYIDNMAKAVNVFGDTLRPTDFYETFKYGRAATNALSDDFMLSTAPTLAQELGGSSAGKALSSFHTQFVGGKMSNKAVEQLQKYDMIDPKKVIKTSTGNVKGVMPGGIAGQEYLRPGQEDPYAWVNKVLIPKLAAKGVTDPAEVQEVISAMASQQTSAQMMSIFAGQQPRIEKDKALIRGAKGIDAADDFMRKDPKVGAKSIIEQSNNILQNATGPAMEKAAPIMHSFAGSLAEIAETAKDHPQLSTIATGGVLSGLLAGGAKGASMLLPALFGNLPEGGLAKAVGSTLGTGAKWAARGTGWTTAAMLAYEAYQNRDELGRDIVGKGEHATTDDPLQSSYDRDHPRDTIERLRQQVAERNANRMIFKGKAAPFAPYSPQLELPPGFLAGGQSSPQSGQVTATLTGSARVDGETKLTITIEAPDVLKAMSKAEAIVRMNGALNAGSNGPGSTGRSSPDAAAPPPRNLGYGGSH
ncbi:MAG: hypothetical protein JWQ94_83 [Tardiphaga sp.]|nr:hypothetical protein [Tardiphaga sp.]